MSYTKTTNFAIKDSLLTGDSNKVVRGYEVDVEFNAIQQAIAYLDAYLTGVIARRDGTSYERQTAAEGQTEFDLQYPYIVGSKSLSVYHNGKKLILGADYTETNESQITILSAAIIHEGDFIVTTVEVVGSSGGSRIISTETATATAGQTEFTPTNFYTPGDNSLTVYQNGIRLSLPSDYIETSANRIDLVSGSAVSDEDTFEFVRRQVDIADVVGEIVTELHTATEGQSIFNLTASYVKGKSLIAVFQNGERLNSGVDYIEYDSKTIVLVTGAEALLDDKFEFVISTPAYRDVFSVYDYGGKKTETGANNTIAFNAAWAAANPAAVLVPAGTYAISGTVTGKFYSFGAVTITGGVVNTITNLVP